MKKLTVLVDFDDTIENLSDAWVDYLNAKHNMNVKHQDIHSWDMWKYFPTLSTDDVYDPLYQEDFWDTVRPLPGAVEYLQKLYTDGHRVVYVTASDYLTIKPKMERVIFKYFPFIKWKDVIIASHKQDIIGDVLIDDGIHNLVGGKYEKVLMTAPHNMQYNVDDRDIVRVNDWEEAYGVITAMADMEGWGDWYS